MGVQVARDVAGISVGWLGRKALALCLGSKRIAMAIDLFQPGLAVGTVSDGWSEAVFCCVILDQQSPSIGGEEYAK